MQVDGRIEEGQKQVDQGPKAGSEQIELILEVLQGDWGYQHDS